MAAFVESNVEVDHETLFDLWNSMCKTEHLCLEAVIQEYDEQLLGLEYARYLAFESSRTSEGYNA